MTLKEFQDLIGGKHATVMVCQVDGTSHYGFIYKIGDMINVDLKTAFALYKQMANSPGGEVRRWMPKDITMTINEAQLLNTHFEKEHQKESGDKPIKIKSHKK